MLQRTRAIVTAVLATLTLLSLTGCPDLRVVHTTEGQRFVVTERHPGAPSRVLEITFTVHRDRPGQRALSDVNLTPSPTEDLMLQKLAAALNDAALSATDTWAWPHSLRSVPREARSPLLLIQLALASLESPASGGQIRHTDLSLWGEAPTFSQVEVTRVGPHLTVKALALGHKNGTTAMGSTHLKGRMDGSREVRLEGTRTLSGQPPTQVSIAFAAL